MAILQRWLFYAVLYSEQLKLTRKQNMLHIELVERCKANDRKAQLKLYRQYCDGMYGVAMRFLKNADDAEDVLQEAFIKAFQKIHQFKGEVTFGAWLKRIVVNHSIDYLKTKQQQRTVDLDEGYMQVAGEDSWEVNETIDTNEVTKRIEALPEKYRFVVQLYLVEGYDHAEISQILSISETASRTRLLRGKGHLKELLKDMSYGT